MERDAILVELYNAHLKSKDAFTDRMFGLNRHYLILIIVLLLVGLMYTIKGGNLIVIPIAVVGTVVSLLWWFNQDAYNVQIKVKYAGILEKMEEELPISPLKDEYQMMKENTSKKKQFIFPETLKFFAAATFIIFIVMFCISFITTIMMYLNL